MLELHCFDLLRKFFVLQIVVQKIHNVSKQWSLSMHLATTITSSFSPEAGVYGTTATTTTSDSSESLYSHDFPLPLSSSVDALRSPSYFPTLLLQAQNPPALQNLSL